MSYVKLTVQSAQRSASMLIPTRDRDGAPLAEGDVLGCLQVAVADLFYLSLGYPERDYLEDADPWHPAGEEAAPAPDPDVPLGQVLCRCGARALGRPGGVYRCSRSNWTIDTCDELPF
jgi:hypothetical protein